MYPLTLILVSLSPAKSTSENVSKCHFSSFVGSIHRPVSFVSIAYFITCSNSFHCMVLAPSIAFDIFLVQFNRSGCECFTKYSSIPIPPRNSFCVLSLIFEVSVVGQTARKPSGLGVLGTFMLFVNVPKHCCKLLCR